ncbi:MAG: hypothetical protein ABMA15_15885 [Vicinamibacterales bacterium]
MRRRLFFIEARELMRYERIGLSLFGAIALLVIVLAVATIWLFLTSPVTVATAVNDGEISPFVRQLADVLLTALEGLLRYF